MSLKSVRKRRQQLHVRDVRGLDAFGFCPLEETKKKKKSKKKIVFSVYPFSEVQTVFTLTSRPDKHAGLLKFYFKPRIKKLKFSILVAKSDFRFKTY